MYYEGEPSPPERYIYPITFPDYPIQPTSLSYKVLGELHKFGNVIPSKTAQMVEDLCKTFNKVINLNASKEPPQTLIVSPKTGSAKSLSAKMYVSMLEEESSIIVVSSVEDAIEFCEDINAQRATDDYARCYYTISPKNRDHKYRVERNKLSHHRCIVVTHAMFTIANRFEAIDNFSNFKKRKRDLVIIDERINLYTRYSISDDQVKELIKVATGLMKTNTLKLSSEVDILNKISKLFQTLKEKADEKNTNILLEVKSPKKKIYKKSPFPSAVVKNEADIVLSNIDFSNFKEIVQDMQYDIPYETSTVTVSGSRKDSKTIENFLSAIEYISKNDCSFHKQGRYNLLMSTDNILNQFGSSVILDATAGVNEIYNISTWHQPDYIKHVETTNPRIYSNFTINKAIGFAQGKDKIFKKLNDEELEEVKIAYLDTIEEIMKPNDKLLIVVHKGFRELIEKEALKLQITGQKIVFTHWGNHRGKNNWSDCNKVLIIGWNYLPSQEHYGNYINAVGSLEYAQNYLSSKQLKLTATEFQSTQLADDLVQAIARCSVRKTISTDGNCEISEAYLFYPDTLEGKNVMALIEAEFGDAVIKKWNPVPMNGLQRLLKSHENADRIVTYIQARLQNDKYVKQADVAKYFESITNKISKSASGRVFTGDAFKEMIKDVGIEKYNLNQKSFAYRFIV